VKIPLMKGLATLIHTPIEYTCSSLRNGNMTVQDGRVWVATDPLHPVRFDVAKPQLARILCQMPSLSRASTAGQPPSPDVALYLIVRMKEWLLERLSQG
jgi:hypothetical protein